eukprot:6458880-Amphidinium_carterae.1
MSTDHFIGCFRERIQCNKGQGITAQSVHLVTGARVHRGHASLASSLAAGEQEKHKQHPHPASY